MSHTSFETFTELASRGTFVPVCKEIRADLLTPLSAFLKVAENADHAFLFESVEGGGADRSLLLPWEGPISRAPVAGRRHHRRRER